jgi:hypothetical protein
MAFKKAVKSGQKLRLAITGPSGSGKTYSALSIAAAMVAGTGKRVALIDTEHGSSGKYANLFDFDNEVMEGPYDPRTLITKIMECEAAGEYGVLIIDSLSHFWEGSGGLLEMVDKFGNKNKGNKFAGWKEGTPIQNQMIEAMLALPMHVIVTMRAKQEHVLDDSSGKNKVIKLGMKPIQRDGVDFEFDIVMAMTAGVGFIEKTRHSAIREEEFPFPGEEFAKILMEWLADSEPIVVTDEARKKQFWPILRDRLAELSYDPKEWKNALSDLSIRGLTWAEEILIYMDKSDWVAAMATDMTKNPPPREDDE